MAKKFPIHPVHPERICWGCDKYCSVDALACGNGSDRTQHPSELFGDDWMDPILPFGAADERTPPPDAKKPAQGRLSEAESNALASALPNALTSPRGGASTSS